MQKAQVRYLVTLWCSCSKWLCCDLITCVKDSYAEKLNLMPADTRGHSKDMYSPCEYCTTAFFFFFLGFLVLIKEIKNKLFINYILLIFVSLIEKRQYKSAFSIVFGLSTFIFFFYHNTLLFIIKLWKVSHCHLVVRLDSCAFLSG